VNERTWYAEGFEKHYRAVLGMIRYFFTQLADEAIEIAARAVMLAAPMPNAISMFNITQREQGFTGFQALAFSLTLEIVVFLLVEIALLMWNGYLANPRAYKWPFAIMTSVVLVATVIVVSIVYSLEPHKVMAWLPVISLCSFVGIGLKRWHERNTEEVALPVQNVKRTVKPSVNPIVKFDSETSVNFTPTKVDSRRESLLKMLEEIDGLAIDALNKSELARKLEVSRPTLLSDIAALENAGKLTLNGHIKVGKQV